MKKFIFMRYKISSLEVAHFFLTTWILIIGCNNINYERNRETNLNSFDSFQKMNEDNRISQFKNENDTVIIEERNEIFDYEYFYEVLSFNKLLQIKYIKENEIKFKIKIDAIDSRCEDVEIVGNAHIRDSKFGTEIDEDEEGNAYPVNEFEYKNGECYIRIRISMIKRDKASINFFGCGNVCNLESSTVLKLKERRIIR